MGMAIRADQTGICPHCKVQVRFENVYLSPRGNLGELDLLTFITPSTYKIQVSAVGCPACGRPIITATRLLDPNDREEALDSLLWPDTGARPVPSEVEDQAPGLAADFREAVSVFPKSKKASAALSRRCLQFILREKAGTKSKDLSGQIDEVLDELPSELASNVDSIRHVGNFAAHPLKSQSSGEIVEVEEGEAEWLLDVLEELFDHYYVVPTKAAARRDALNKKLKELGKPPLKAPKTESLSTPDDD
jgi:hypothetical protein